PQEPALQQLGVEPVGFRSAMLTRYRDTRGMDHVSLDAARLKQARQPEAVAAGFEGKRNPRDRAAGPDRLILPAMQQGKQPFWARIELLARLTLNAGKHAGNEPARLAHLDDGYDRAILVQGDEGSAQSLPRRRPGAFGWGIAALHRLNAATKLPFPLRPPHSVSRSLSGRSRSSSSIRSSSTRPRQETIPAVIIGDSVADKLPVKVIRIIPPSYLPRLALLSWRSLRPYRNMAGQY